MLNKKCSKCKKVLSINSFYKGKYRVLSACKNCRRIHKNKEADRLYQKRKRAQDPAKKVLSETLYKKKNPEKVSAHRRVLKAVRSGLLIKSDCVCGESKVQAHHPDYSKPLEVIWLCASCHKLLHAKVDSKRLEKVN